MKEIILQLLQIEEVREAIILIFILITRDFTKPFFLRKLKKKENEINEQKNQENAL
jgi:hypothetical protein